MRRYLVQPADSLWTVASAIQAGGSQERYSAIVDAIVTLNPTIYDFSALAVGQIIWIPA